MSKSTYEEKLASNDRTHCPDELALVVRESGAVRRYGPGETIMRAGDISDTILFILSGQARLLTRAPDNKCVAIEILHPGDTIGEVGFFAGCTLPPNRELRADDACTVVEISVEKFEQILRDKPSVALALIKSLSAQIVRLDRNVAEAGLKRRALQSLISRKEYVVPDYVASEYVRGQLMTQVRELAESEEPVLIVGEDGVGKEFFAHSLFQMGSDREDVFLVLDLSREVAESSEDGLRPGRLREQEDPAAAQFRLLFGTEDGDRQEDKDYTAGYVDFSENGTLLVNRAEKLFPDVQQRLLDCVRSGHFRRVGGSGSQRCNFRLIATTTVDPAGVEAAEHPLIHGLLDRCIRIPPLRKRRKDLPLLVDHYLGKYGKDIGEDPPELPKETLNALVNYSWPGNDMELASTLKRALVMSEGAPLRPKDIHFDLTRPEGKGRFNLLKLAPVKRAVLSPLFPAVLQSATAPFFLILLALLFFGPTDPVKNAGALFCWAVGWPVLIIGAFFWARFWCTLCPIGTLSALAKRIVSWERPFPLFLKKHSDFLIAGAVLGIIWFETATDIRNSPLNLGLLLLAMLISAVGIATVFERQSWCRYLCGLGGMIGVAAKTAIVEVRADSNVCISQCTGNECYEGTETLAGCPLGQAGPRLDSNRLCKMCGACVKNCPHDAINFNVRIPGNEILEMRRTNTGTAFLVIGMIAGLLSELLVKTSFYGMVANFLPLPEVVRFTIVFLGSVLAANVLVVAASAISRTVQGTTLEDNYCRYGLALLPLTLASFMSFHVYYLINLGVQLPILAGENFDFAILKRLVVTVPAGTTHFIQRLIVWVGLAWSLILIYRLGRGEQDGLADWLTAVLPHAVVAISLGMLVLRGIQVAYY
ncbi:sigma 54-interacting transcriptional regulator [Thermodesulfobacteriota bacterium]